MNAEFVYFNIFLACGVMHLALTAVMALFARHQIKFLSLAWIMGIFTVCFALALPYYPHEEAHAGIFHPAMLAALMAISFLQSIYPLSIPLPGYLQWGRMWRYALPALIFLGFYAVGYAMGSRGAIIESFDDVRRNLLSSDLLVRLGMLLTSFYYIANIFLLPRRLTHVQYPRYLIGYSMVLGFSALFFLVIAFNYKPYLIAAYAIIFTLLNAYLCLRSLESLARELPKPVVKEVVEAPSDEELKKSESDFNEANLQRFQRAEYWMQHHVEAWTDYTFNRDVLCSEVGINRQLLLQCLRSQGYNNVHEYINRYRLEELKRRIRQGKISALGDCLDAGFGSLKTVRSCFLKLDGISLDQYMQEHAPRKD